MKVAVPDPTGRPVTLLDYAERGEVYDAKRLQATAKVLEERFGELETKLNTGEFLLISYEGWVKDAETGKPLSVSPFLGGGLIQKGDDWWQFLFGRSCATFLRSIRELPMPFIRKLDISVHVEAYRDVGYVTVEARDPK